MKELKYGKAICYSGYREGQSPITGVYPTYEEVKEDLLILSKDYDYIRMYDPSQHAKTALEVIRQEHLDLQVVLGIDLQGEISNPQCAWGGVYSEETLAKHTQANEQNLRELIRLAHDYEDIIVAVSAGNEAVPEWNENLVSPQRVLYFVEQLKAETNQLVTYCENNNYWIGLLEEVAKAVDFISLHTYPVWIGRSVEEGLATSIEDYEKIAAHYPDKPCIITEAGWTTMSNGRGILPESAGLDFQKRYLREMDRWSEENQILVFFFEAFDEPWKGGDDPQEPEKHWGIYDVDRHLK